MRPSLAAYPGGETVRLNPEERDAIVRQMEEIASQVENLRGAEGDLPLVERVRTSLALTDNWLANFRRLRDGSALL
jgi:hypothetical protein